MLFVASARPEFRGCRLALILISTAGLFAAADPAGTLRLNPANPHYFEWRGQPTVVITSGEHYGALVNLDFNYRKYLDALAADHLNGTRLFLAYREQPTAFNITGNSLAPKPDRFVAPWACTAKPGYYDGGNKFDLERWDPAYFVRLKDFIAHASRRGVVVEANLFSCFYSDSSWNTHPFNARNNVNGVGAVKWNEALSLRDPALVAAQERYVLKIVEELRDFDNVYYEICNEPYIGGVTREWEMHMTGIVAEAQKSHAHLKLISWNIANNTAKVENPPAAVSIFNFHYAAPPEAVAENYALGRVVGDNETGFRGTNDAPYRMEAWDFILAGGGLFNHLDYSFSPGHEDGTYRYPATQPGGGNPQLRREFRALRDFIQGYDFLRMHPDNSVIVDGVPLSHTGRVLAEPGRAFALYFRPWIITRFSVRWTGFLEVPETADYTLHTLSNDGVRLWVDGRQLVNNWTDHGETEDTGILRLEAGRSYPVKLEYFYNGGQSVIKLGWSRPGRAKEPVPASALHVTPGGSSGLHGEYFADTTLGRAWHSRDDAQVNFAWGTGPPFAVPGGETPSPLRLNLPAGHWDAAWVDPRTGAVLRHERFEHSGGLHSLTTPMFTEDIALRVVRR